MSTVLFHVIGAGRGGTSLMYALLNAHPECEMLGERHSIANLMAATGSRQDHQTLESRTRSRVAGFIEACNSSAIMSEKSYWGHKSTTEHVLGLYDPYLPMGKSFVPETYFVAATSDIPTIFITRDGRTCIPSKVRRTGQPFELAVERWKFSIRLLKVYQERHPALMVVRMEDLVLEPTSTLTKACHFLGLPFRQEMLAGTQSMTIRPEYRRDGFDTSTVLFKDNPEWVGMIHSELLQAGYETENSAIGQKGN